MERVHVADLSFCKNMWFIHPLLDSLRYQQGHDNLTCMIIHNNTRIKANILRVAQKRPLIRRCARSPDSGCSTWIPRARRSCPRVWPGAAARPRSRRRRPSDCTHCPGQREAGPESGMSEKSYIETPSSLLIEATGTILRIGSSTIYAT